MGKHVKKKKNALRGGPADPVSARREAGEDNFDVRFDYLSGGSGEPFGTDAPGETTYTEPEIEEPAYTGPETGEATYTESETEEPAYTEPETGEPESGEPPRRGAPSRRAAPQRTAPKKRPAGKAAGKKSVRRKKKNAFRRGLLVYFLFLVICVAGVLAVEWVALVRSQARFDAEAAEKARIEAEKEAREAQERAVYEAPQRCFENWLSGCTGEYWARQWTSTPAGALDGYDNVLGEMGRIFDPAAVKAYKSLDYTDETPVYVLKNGDRTLARITLTGSGTDWAVDRVELQFQGEQSVSVRVSTGSKVYCNGVELGAEFITDSSSYFTYEPLRDQLINPVSWNTYTVEGLLLEPDVTVEPMPGSSVTETAEGDYLLCLDSGEGLGYRDKALAFVKSYLYYFMSGYNNTWGNLYAALAYLTPGTQAYQTLYDTYNGVIWNTAYGNIDTSDTTAGEVVIWADNCYSVDVTYNAKCSLNGEVIDYDSATMRIYFLETDGAFSISNFEIL